MLLAIAAVEAFAPMSRASRHPTFVASPQRSVTAPSSTSLEMGLIRSVFGRKATEAPEITAEEVRALFTRWNDALATEDSRLVAARYSSDALLLPTVSDTPRDSYTLIKDYFDSFLLKKPQGVITDGNIRIGDGWAQDAGIYEFTMGATGDVVKARYSFVYVYEDGQWKISHHHSSVMPESIL